MNIGKVLEEVVITPREEFEELLHVECERSSVIEAACPGDRLQPAEPEPALS